MKPLTVYIAGPISGLSYDDVVSRHKTQVTFFESMGFHVLYPMLGKGYLRNEETFKNRGYNTPISTNRAIVSRDNWMVHQSDIVFADLTPADHVSIGTVCEISWAFELHKHIVVVMSEDNIHQHAFVTNQANIVFNNLEQAQKYFEDFSCGLLCL